MRLSQAFNAITMQRRLLIQLSVDSTFARLARPPFRRFSNTAHLREVNTFGVDLLSSSYQNKLFKNVKVLEVSQETKEQAVRELEKFGLLTGGEHVDLPDVTQHMPPLVGDNVLEHFHKLATRQTESYEELINRLVSSKTPPPPSTSSWKLISGWTRYGHDGSVESVSHPLENCIVFDVEVSVKTDPRAVMAVACTDQAWYCWLSKELLTATQFPSTVTPDTMIPMGQSDDPRLIIGHNVAYDRIRIADEYRLQKSGTRYLDTMSLHIATSGMTSSQRMFYQSDKSKSAGTAKPKWLQRTSMNNLADVHRFYCQPDTELNKDPRESFVKLSLSELQCDIPNLVTYCATDVQATLDVLRVLFPKFQRSCPHPATLAGFLTMSTSYLPTNTAWNRYISDAESAYVRLEENMMRELMEEVKSAVNMIKDKSYLQDPWLWDLEWKLGSKKSRKGRLTHQLYEKEPEEIKKIFSQGFPNWYQDLVGEGANGEPKLNISTSKRVVPKILRLTWNGYPLHYDKKEKWGYLVPTEDAVQVLEDIEDGVYDQASVSGFPLREYLQLFPEEAASLASSSLHSPGTEETSRGPSHLADLIQDIPDYSDAPHKKDVQPKKIAVNESVLEDLEMDIIQEEGIEFLRERNTNKRHEEAGPGLDVGIPGVVFHKLPHKNGPKYRVGNPLGKDFLAACSEGGALGSKLSRNIAGELLRTSSQLAYWRNAKDRLSEQIKVELPDSYLPEAVKKHVDYRQEPDQQPAAILPALVVAGTVTRRAVEKTWLTASNARPDRVGSELKTAVRAPPGYHFVGADVDSQELWLASVMGDAIRGGHGATPLGWMSLQGERSKGTDLHSKTAAAAQVTRDQAKILNYARIYGAGEQFAKLLLKQFNPGLSDAEVAYRAKHMYEQTKGLRAYKLNETGAWLYDLFFNTTDVPYSGETINKRTMNILAKKMGFINKIVRESKKVMIQLPDGSEEPITCHALNEESKTLYAQFSGNSVNIDMNSELLLDSEKLKEFIEHLEQMYSPDTKSDFDVFNSLVQQTIWYGGSESHTFNRLEEIAMSDQPATPVLGASVSQALDTRIIGRSYLPSRINWVVQSTAVDFLHLLVVANEWLFQEFGIDGRFTISIHDEIRYLVKSEDRYLAAFALHLSNLLVRSAVVARLGMDNLPSCTAFFSSVDIDRVLRKDPGNDCVTPSNPLGLEKGHGIEKGETLTIVQVLEKLKLT